MYQILFKKWLRLVCAVNE